MRLNRRLLISIAGTFAVLLLLKFFINWYIQDDLLNRGSYKRSGVKTPSRYNVKHAAGVLSSEKESAGELCWYDEECPSPQILFRLHAETADAPPFACLNDIRLFDESHVGPGLNLVALNGSSGDIVDTATFDVASSDQKLIEWLRSLSDSSVIVGVSFGDVAERVSADARNALVAYGASQVKDWRGSNAYAIIGQRGLKGHAHEQMFPLSSTTSKVLEGCFELPLGDIGYVNLTESNLGDVHRVDETKLAELAGESVDHLSGTAVQLGKQWDNCGMDKPCKKDELSLHLFSGEHKDDHPRICVGGRMVFDEGLNGAGRGLNLVAVEPKTGRVRALAHFDTYQDDSTGLEEWLDSVSSGDIVAVVSFDEASTTLSDMSKRIFYEMGSSKIDRLKFRASWYFVGHKGITAYSPFEDLNIPSGNNWAKPIKKSFCLPRSLSKWRGSATDSAPSRRTDRNLPKRHFCAKHDKHGQFCHESTVDNLIAPKLLTDKSREGDAIFNTPILIVAGLSTPSLRKTLESLMEQEGLNTQMVLVAYDKEYSENSDLSTLFHAKSLALNASQGYSALLVSSLTAAFSVFPDAPAVAVIEEEVTLSPDWLFFLSQTLKTLIDDHSVDLVQAFNPNGFVNTSSRPSQLYRISYQPPQYSYLMSRRLFERHIQGTTGCCDASVQLGRWRLGSASALVPEVSRVSVAVPPDVPPVPWTLEALFNRNRTVSTDPLTKLSTEFSSQSAYDASIKKLLEKAAVVSLVKFDCGNWRAKYANDSALAVTCGDEFGDLARAARCFGLFFDQKFVTGVYKRIIRLYADDHLDVFIIPSGSSFSPFLNETLATI